MRRTAGTALVLRELRAETRTLAAATLLVVASAAAAVATPSLVAWAIDDGVRRSDTSVVWAAVGWLALVSIVSGVAAGARTTTLAVMGQRVVHRIRVGAVRGVLAEPLGSFERRRRGDVVARITSDVDRFSTAVTQAVPFVVGDAVALAAAFVGLLVLSPVVAGLCLLVVPPVATAGRWLTRRAPTVYAEERARSGAMTANLTETIEGAPTIRAFLQQGQRLAVAAAADAQLVGGYLAGMRMRNRFNVSVTTAQSTVTAIVVVTIAALARDGDLSVGVLAAGALALTSVYRPLVGLLEWLDELQSARAALDRTAALVDLQRSPAGRPTTSRDAGEDGAAGEAGDVVIAFDRVSFGYVAGREVLHDVAFTVRRGEHVALVGPTGAGKSTIGRLITGLADPSAGSVVVRHERPVVLVVQEGFLVEGAIRDNLLLTAPGATDDDLVAAVRSLGLGGWLDDLPGGLSHPVRSLSAGEEQLVNLVRAVLVDPDVVVLDEATSVLDPVTEGRVGEALSHLLHGRTVVVVAHRAVTAQRCDRRLVIEAGRLVADDRDSRSSHR